MVKQLFASSELNSWWVRPNCEKLRYEAAAPVPGLKVKNASPFPCSWFTGIHGDPNCSFVHTDGQICFPGLKPMHWKLWGRIILVLVSLPWCVESIEAREEC